MVQQNLFRRFACLGEWHLRILADHLESTSRAEHDDPALAAVTNSATEAGCTLVPDAIRTLSRFEGAHAYFSQMSSGHASLFLVSEIARVGVVLYAPPRSGAQQKMMRLQSLTV